MQAAPDPQDPTERFGNRVAAYVAARPDYPAALAALLMERLQLRPPCHVVDVGCGTGLSSRPFVDAGCTVTGVEPNAAMRAAAARAFAGDDRFTVVGGRAEATTLAAVSADLVVAGQAFHWFEPDAFAREVRRVLRPGGAVALFWNKRHDDASPFMRAYEAVLVDHCPAYVGRFRNDQDIGVRHGEAMRRVFGADFGADVAEASLPHEQRLDRDGLVARVLSDSYAPTPADPAYPALVAALHALFARHAADDRVALVYRTRIFFGRTH